MGVLSGIMGIIAYLILLYLDPNLLFLYLGLVAIGIASFFMLLTAILAKHQLKLHNDLTFKNLLRPTYLNFIIFLAILIGFQYIMYNFIEPTLASQFKAFYIDQQTARASTTDLSERQIQQGINALQAGDFNMTIKKTLSQFVGFLLPGFLLALLTTLLAQYLPTFSKKTK